MKRIIMSFALALFVCAAVTTWAQDETEFTFQTIVFPGDPTFTQLLGINLASTIAGYHGMTINKGFVLTLPNSFTNQNFPYSMQTQVIGINNSNNTAGFYISKTGITHGFVQKNGSFTTVDFPGTTFNQLLGLNNHNQAAGYFMDSMGNDHAYTYDKLGGVFREIVIPGALSSQATGINDNDQVSGFYVDAKGANHGFVLSPGFLQKLDFPGSSFTQALGLNNKGLVVGFYDDAKGMNHGFVYNPDAYDEVYDSIDDPHGVGTTIINGINDRGRVVGFFADAAQNNNTEGFVGTPIE